MPDPYPEVHLRHDATAHAQPPPLLCLSSGRPQTALRMRQNFSHGYAFSWSMSGMLLNINEETSSDS